MEPIAATWPDFYYVVTHAEAFQLEYFQDKWNYMDVLVYALLLTGELLQVIGVQLDEKHLLYIGIRILLLGLVLAWLKLLKFARSFESVGPFVVMLGDMLNDTVKFCFLFLILFVPFTVAFVTVFSTVETEDGYFPYKNFAASAFHVFRITMVDYDYDILRDKDSMTAGILVFLWLFFSSIVFLNLFIAMMANTFQAIADNAARISAMERASTLATMLKSFSPQKANRIRLEILADLESNGTGSERYLTQFYDDPDDDDSSLANVRLEIMAAVNKQQQVCRDAHSTVNKS